MISAASKSVSMGIVFIAVVSNDLEHR